MKKHIAALAVCWIGGVVYASSNLAYAAGGGSGDTSVPMVLMLLALAAGAYLLAHFVVDRLQRRYLFVSGLEYIGLGILLGPFVFSQVHVLENLTQLSPVIAFAAGWVGLLYGMEFDLKGLLAKADEASVRIALSEGVVAGITVTGVSYWALTQGWLLDAPVVVSGAEQAAGAASAMALSLAYPEGVAAVLVPRAQLAVVEAAGAQWISLSQAWMAAGTLGCAAAAGSSSAVDLVSRRYGHLETKLLPTLRRAARFGDLLAILALGLLFCIFHQGQTNTLRPPAISDWVLLTVGVGVGLGFLFVLFIGNDESENNRFLALVGIIVFASGSAFFLNLSPLTVNLLLGVVLVNTRAGVGVRETLQTSLRPVGLILLVFAGAMWEPVDPLAAALMCTGYVLLRAFTKAVGGFIASFGTSLRRDIFRGLMAQGEVALAIALSFRLVYDGPAVELAYTAILASVVVNELVAPRLLQGLLIDAGELDRDLVGARSAA